MQKTYIFVVKKKFEVLFLEYIINLRHLCHSRSKTLIC